jgi:hypothetical protein
MAKVPISLCVALLLPLSDFSLYRLPCFFAQDSAQNLFKRAPSKFGLLSPLFKAHQQIR